MGVDSDYLTFQVKQRAAGVTRIDGNVGLDERRVAFVRQAASFGGHDARSNAVVKAERRTDGGNPFARFQIFQLGGVFAFVVEQDFDIAHTGDDVGIGQDIAVFTDDEAGAEVQILVGRLVFRHIGHIRDKAFEKLVKRVVVRELAQIHALLFRLPAACGTPCRGSLDIDHRLTFVLHQLCKIGQQHTDAAVIFGRFYSLYEFFAFTAAAKEAADFVTAAQGQRRSRYQSKVSVFVHFFAHRVSFSE